MLRRISILLFLFTFSYCSFLPEKEERPPENPYRAEMLKKLRAKIECESCNPTKEELVLFYYNSPLLCASLAASLRELTLSLERILRM